jgi:hypothetical protein
MSTTSAQKEDRIVFTAREAGYSVRDVIDAAHFRGEVQALWEKLLTRLEAQRLAEDEDAELNEAAVDEAATAFRYRHDLITAEETERWLERRGLTVEDFNDYFVREFWETTRPAKANVAVVPFEQASAEQRDLFAAELIFSGELDRMAERLAWRVAAQETDGRAEPLTDIERKQFAERDSDLAPWLAGLARDDSWFERMIAMEGAFRRASQKLLTPAAMERELEVLRLPLTRFEVETIEVTSRDAAREAVLCVRSDGASMAEVAEQSGYAYRRAELHLADVSEGLQQRFLSVTPGSVLEPIARTNGFEVTRLLSKSEPRMSDSAVRQEIEQRLIQRHFAALASERIRWEIPLALTG